MNDTPNTTPSLPLDTPYPVHADGVPGCCGFGAALDPAAVADLRESYDRTAAMADEMLLILTRSGKDMYVGFETQDPTGDQLADAITRMETLAQLTAAQHRLAVAAHARLLLTASAILGDC